MQENKLLHRNNSRNRANKAKNGKVYQVLSVFTLLARSSFYKIMGVLVVMAVGEVMAIQWMLTHNQYWSMTKMPAPEAMIDDAYIGFFFLGGMGLIMLILLWTETRMSEKAGYTMMRLRLSRKELFAVKTVYNAVCLVLLFVVQIWLGIWMVGCCREYILTQLPTPQFLFMTFYRNKFLHCVLPMQEIGKWIRNILMITALSMGAAGTIAYPGEKGNKFSGAGFLTILTLGWFVSQAGKNLLDMLCDLVYVWGIVAELLKVYGVFGRLEARREDEEE